MWLASVEICRDLSQLVSFILLLEPELKDKLTNWFGKIVSSMSLLEVLYLACRLMLPLFSKVWCIWKGSPWVSFSPVVNMAITKLLKAFNLVNIGEQLLEFSQFLMIVLVTYTCYTNYQFLNHRNWTCNWISTPAFEAHDFMLSGNNRC